MVHLTMCKIITHTIGLQHRAQSQYMRHRVILEYWVISDIIRKAIGVLDNAQDHHTAHRLTTQNTKSLHRIQGRLRMPDHLMVLLDKLWGTRKYTRSSNRAQSRYKGHKRHYTWHRVITIYKICTHGMGHQTGH